MENNVQDIQPIQTWGAFYFVRRAMDIRTHAESWQLESLRIIGKIIALTVAFAVDVVTGLLYLAFVLLKKLVILFYKILVYTLSELIKRLAGILAYLISLVLTIVVLYIIVTHWHSFTNIVNHLINLINVK